MAELNLKQISDRLNEMFRGDGKEGDRRLVFWYDDRKEFTDDIDEIEPELENAKVYRLETNNQFFTKRFLEREDRKINALRNNKEEKNERGTRHSTLLKLL